METEAIYPSKAIYLTKAYAKLLFMFKEQSKDAKESFEKISGLNNLVNYYEGQEKAFTRCADMMQEIHELLTNKYV